MQDFVKRVVWVVAAVLDEKSHFFDAPCRQYQQSIQDF